MSEFEACFEVNDRIQIPWRELRFTYARSSGAGGQNVNKTNSKAVLRWVPRESSGLPPGVLQRFLETFSSRLSESGELILMSDVHRDQIRNRDDCLARLASMLKSVARPPKARIKTKPTKSSKRKRLAAKKLHSDKKGQRRKPTSFD